MQTSRDIANRSALASTVARGFDLRRVASGITVRHDPGHDQADQSSAESKLQRDSAFEIESRIELPIHTTTILFAAEEILYDSTDWWRWVIRVLTRSGLQTQYEAIYRVWRRDYLQSINQTQADYWTAFERFLLAVGCGRGQINEILTTAVPRRRQFEREIRVNPGVVSILNHLQLRGFRLGVLSCAPISSSDFQQRLGRMGLMQYFDWSATAWELTASTHDSATYAKIAKQMGSTTGVVAVGRDGLEIQAANQAGITPINLAGSNQQWLKVRVSHLGVLSGILSPAISNLDS